MKHFDLFSGYGGFSLALKRVYEANITISRNRGSRPKHWGSSQGLLQGGALSTVEEPSFTTIGFSEIDKYASSVLKYHWHNTKNYGDITKINWSEVPDFDILTGGSPCQDLSIAGKRKGLDGERSGLFYEYLRAVREKKPKYFIWENVKGALSSNKGWDFATVINEFSEAGYSLWWQVLNAKDFSVPQNRERIFVVGFRDGNPREVLFESKANGINIQQNKEFPVQSSNCLRTNYSSGYSNETYVSEQPRIRRLTPIECERLMGLPDGWTAKGIIDNKEVDISDSQRYKLCGNGVVVNVVEEILKQIIKVL